MIGNKRERVTIVTFEDLKDPGGGVTPGQRVVYWETWANVTTIKNQRNAQAYQTDLEEPKEFAIRYRPDKQLTKNMIIEYRSAKYTIQSNINVDERMRELTIIGLTRK
ncbi:phage head closure protein [Pedobacter cryoconitis]|uniref:SPP1 family predicted phage head-tail adaptor n=1 Tax=Pedobacter cryoconitis TaxID=188932 RepID=A0A327SJ64_9SPHI|nr:phage head closure protein [Pedobacter cryoconitis]RAJ28871.1 SPP1 family predicted phage head-tail adaptor [Pedobacter cryoconitis]